MLIEDQGYAGALTRFVIAQGVEAHPDALKAYLTSQHTFSVRRLDLVLGGEKVICAESDEQPGGLARAFFLDSVYDVNQARWKHAFDGLTKAGLLVFVVSSTWSSVYVTETQWLVAQLQAKGYPVEIVLTNQPNKVKFSDDGVYLDDGRKIATIWRLFPIFEAKSKWLTLVKRAELGQLRIVPEFASFGNKSYMALFYALGDTFRNLMGSTAYDRLSHSLPHTLLFPDTQRLKNFAELRSSYILKVSGANSAATRSHGITIGKTLSVKKWHEAIDELATQGPLIAQEFFPPKTFHHQAASFLEGKHGELIDLSSYGLARPWVIDGELVSCPLFTSSNDSYILHGKVTNCEISVDLDNVSL